MLYRDFKETEDYKYADVITFVSMDGEELDITDPDSEDMDGLYVESWHSNNGYLEIVLN